MPKKSTTNPSPPHASGEDPSAAAAHMLWVELATRITTQRLHYRSGDEETAATSIYSLFGTVRKLMTEHREAGEFHRVALALLNDTLRPFTARWHGWMTQDGDKLDKDGKPILKFRDARVRRKFREELGELQPRLFGFQKTLKAMSRGGDAYARWLELARDPQLLVELAECQCSSASASLGGRVELRLRDQVKLWDADPAGCGKKGIMEDIESSERAAITKRRAVLRGSPRGAADEAGSPQVNDATALALSGGGIRSATFCLGIVQALQRHGLIEQFDYLSTVSGGGYLGSFISCYLGADPKRLDEVEQRVEMDRGKPLEKAASPEPISKAMHPNEEDEQRALLKEAFDPPPSGGSESPAMRHLRNNSRYLLNGGGWGLLRIGGVLVTGFVTSLLMLLTLPITAAWALRGVKEPAIADFFSDHLWLLDPWRNWLSLGLAGVVGVAGVWGGWVSLRSGKSPDSSARGGANNCCAKIAIGVAAVWAAAIATRRLGLKAVYPPGLELSKAWAHPAAIAFAGTLSLLAIFWFLMPIIQQWAQGTKLDSKESKARSVIESTSLVMAIIAVVIGAVCAAFPLVEGYEDLRANMGKVVDRLLKWTPPELLATALLSIVPAIFGGFMKRKDGSVRGWAQWLFHLTAPAFFLVAFLVFASNLGVGRAPRWELRTAGWMTVSLLVWAYFSSNINTFAPHRYYRNRLCECYLAMKGRRQRTWLRRTLDQLFHGVSDDGPTEQFEGIGTLLRLPLTMLGTYVAAPYHLINATLNAEASKNPNLRGRNGDFFIFSRHYCGSPLTGYMTTENLGKVDRHIDLGTAMAISGAAASTNMGWQTLRQMRFLMTLFNVRLGYWMRRPGSTGLWRPFEGPGPLYFLREMHGAVHEKTRYVNLSDGGHIENLAVYELLRRQCKFIVCVDAGMEPGMECADLMRLQRYAAIDFGIRLHFDLTDLTLLPSTYSRAYAVLVKIDYAPPAAGSSDRASTKLGWMLYLKLSVTGIEPRYVLDYRRQNPAFPHQTTADQFYDEEQFEAYRALGECAAESLFREEIVGAQAKPEIEMEIEMEAWFQALANNLLADNDEAFSR